MSIVVSMLLLLHIHWVGARLGDRSLHTCRVSLMASVKYEPQREHRNFFRCVSDDSTTIFLSWEPSDALVRENWQALSDDQWNIQFPKSFIHGEHLMLSSQSKFIETLQKSKRPRIHSVNGTKPIETGIIIRVAGDDIECDLSGDKMIQIAFGAEESAQTQFEACSGGDFKFLPAQVPLVDIRLPGKLSNYSRNTVFDETKKLLCAHFDKPEGCDLVKATGADHIMYVFPRGLKDGNDFGWMLGAVAGSSTLFQEPSFAPESILHEVTHSWAVGHSRESLPSNPDNDTRENPEYGNDSDQMGSSYYLWGKRGNGNHRCYNGQSLWQLGWLPEKRTELFPSESRIIMMGGIAELDAMAESDVIAVKVSDYFVTFNRRIGINSGTPEHSNKVIVVKKVPDQNIDNYYDSDLRAVLDVKGDFQEGELSMHVCSITSETPSLAKISFGPINLCEKHETSTIE